MELYIYGVVYTVLYVILCKMFIEIFAKKRFQNNSKVFFSIVSFVLLEYIVSIVFSKIIVLKQILIIILGGFYACYYFKLKLCKGFFLFLLYHGLCFATDYGVLIVSQNFISNASTSEIVSSNMSLMMGSVSQMLVFCIIIILKKYIKNENLEVLTKFEWIKFSVFPIFSIVSILSIYINFNEINSVKQKNILLCIAFGMLSMNIVVFYLIYGILVRESQINEDKLFFERIKSETEIYRQASKNYVDQRKREHEYKNEMMLISSLIDLKEYDKVRFVIDKFCDKSSCGIHRIDTNNIIIDAIINAKYEEMKDKDILFVFKFNDLSALKLDDRDIVIILSNLLNNAITASEECKNGNRIIKAKLYKYDKKIIISVVNTYSTIPIMEKEKYKTTKKDEDLHGIGIDNIMQAVNKYNGTCVIRHDYQYFYFVIYIPTSY